MKCSPAERERAKLLSDEEVKRSTGKEWKDWFSLLDQFGVAEKGHELTVKYLREHQNLEEKWARLVALRYEDDQGLRSLRT
jgi:hypothetical protein